MIFLLLYLGLKEAAWKMLNVNDFGGYIFT